MDAAVTARRRGGREGQRRLWFLSSLLAFVAFGGALGRGASFCGPPASGRSPVGAASLRVPRVPLRAASAKKNLSSARKNLTEFEVGEELEGTVKAWLGSNGYIIDVGSKIHGHLEACEMTDGFPWQRLKKGRSVKVRVLDVSEEQKQLHLTRRAGSLDRPPRGGLLRNTVTAEDFGRLAKAYGDMPFEGEIHSFAFYGIFIRCKQPDGSGVVDGILHKSSFDKSFGKGAQRGQKVRVQIASREERKLILKLAED